jgi:hypothetical protein
LIEKSLERDQEGRQTLDTARRALLFIAGVESEVGAPESFLHALATLEAFSDSFNVSMYAIG